MKGSGGRQHCIFILAAVVAGMACAPALADLNDLDFDSPIEQAAARANQAVFDALTSGPNPICPVQLAAEAGACTGEVFATFENVRELVETANELTGRGPRTFSLGLDQQNLGFALRWTAAEELAAQGSSSTQFSSSQLNSLASRISALRFGARGPRSASRKSGDPDSRVAGRQSPLGGGAAADEESIASRWGGFIDGSFGYGRKGDTTFVNLAEDAFDYDGTDATVGVDYRLRDPLVIGVIGGYTDKNIDFDSRVSIVDGTIDSNGYSLMFYTLYERESFYLSGSLGGQWLSLDMVRRINYPSLNPLVPLVDERARSDTDSSAILASFNAGYDLNRGGFTFEPFVKAEYQKVSIDAFTEHSANGFDFDIGDQDVKSLDAAVGIKLQYVVTPRWGVVVPFVRGELHKEFENDARVISATYASIDDILTGGNVNFALRTDDPDDKFVQAAAGFSVVLTRGWQGFVQYQQIFDLDTYKDRAITGGVRLEF